MAVDYAGLIRNIGRGMHGFRDMDADAARALFAEMLAGNVPDLELGAILVAMRIKGEALPETLGFLAALDAVVARFDRDPDRPRPVVLPTYNGARRTPNLTALLALLLQRYGVPVLVHGLSGSAAAVDAADGEADEPGADGGRRFGRVTTAEVLEELGIEPAVSVADARDRLVHGGLVYVPTDVLAPGLARLLSTRARIGLRSSAHSLAKLIDPFGGAAVRVVSVTHPEYLTRMREVLAATRANALLLRGTEGEPFANPRRQPRIERYAGGVPSVCVDAEEGTLATLPRLPTAIDAASTAAWIADALAGREPLPGPIVAQLACCMEGAQNLVAVA